MRALGNILWYFPFFGFVDAIAAFLLGGFFILTVVGAPIGLGLIQYSKFLLAPFSYAMIDSGELTAKQNKLWKVWGIVVRVLYFPFGLTLAILTVAQIACLYISIVGIPVAAVLAKSLSTYFNPVNKKCVPVAVRDELERRKASEFVDKHLGKK